jgi:hypothetical protein
MQNSCIIDWELYQKVMAKKKTIKVCTGVGLNMFFPEYVTIELQDIDTKIKKNTIITDWLEEHGDPEIDKKVKKQLKTTKKNG